MNQGNCEQKYLVQYVELPSEGQNWRQFPKTQHSRGCKKLKLKLKSGLQKGKLFIQVLEKRRAPVNDGDDYEEDDG